MQADHSLSCLHEQYTDPEDTKQFVQQNVYTPINLHKSVISYVHMAEDPLSCDATYLKKKIIHTERKLLSVTSKEKVVFVFYISGRFDKFRFDFFTKLSFCFRN